MKLIKIISFLTIIALSSFLLTNVQAQETNTEELANVLLEFEVDEVDAKSLNIEEPTALPGQFRYNWQLFKENAGLFFTFDKEKKVEKLEEISNRRLLEAKKLAEAGIDNAGDRVEEVLKRYEEAKKRIHARLEEDPELKEKLQEKFDANQIKHQQVLSRVNEKLRAKIPEDQINRLENVKEEDALRWYNANKDDIDKRLKNAIDNNDVGSKFKQLKNIATLEELSEILPEEARDKIDAAKTRAEEKLSEKLENTNSEDREKFEKYINNIKAPELVKQKFISNLKDNDILPPSIKEKTANIYEKNTLRIQDRFQRMSIEGQNKFLNQFENGIESHPSYMHLLERLKNKETINRVNDLIEDQSANIKENIQTITEPSRLRIMEQNLQDSPVLRRQIQERKIEIRAELQ